MITLKQLQAIYQYLKKLYPAPLTAEITTYSDLMDLQLSHFYCDGVLNYNAILDITGISHVELNDTWITVDAYATLMARITPIIARGDLLQSPHLIITGNLPTYTIQRIKRKGDIQVPTYLSSAQAYPITNSSMSGDNHFTISSFLIHNNAKQLSEVISRLCKVRNSYSTLHFHLDRNGGGNLIPVHLIMLCLCGGRQRWMTEYEVVEYNKTGNTARKWDPWTPWDPTNNDYKTYLNLDLNITDLLSHTEKYKGKIVIHMDTSNGSATWFFITYLIYVFASRVERFVQYVHGIPIKCGRVRGQHIELHGCSSTTGGDGNAIHKKFRLDGTTVTGWFPTQANRRRPVLERDWNRFWIE